MRSVNDFVIIKLLYEDDMEQRLRVPIVPNVDLKRKAYVLQASVDFSLMIHSISNQKHCS